MSGSKRKNEAQKKDISLSALSHKTLKQWQISIALLIYTGTLGALIIQRIFYLKSYAFQMSLFCFGLSMEFLLFFALWSSCRTKKITPLSFQRYSYLVYTAIGLPFTIYLAQGYGHTALAILRFLSVCALLCSIVSWGKMKWHLCFFFTGLLFYEWFQKAEPFGMGEWGYLLAYALGVWMLALTVQLFFSLQKQQLQLSFHKKKLEKKYTKLYDSWQKAFHFAAPSKWLQSYLHEAKSPHSSGFFIMLAFFFPGLHDSLESFRIQSAHPSGQAREGVEDFGREWTIFTHHLEQRLSQKAGLLCSLGSESLYAGSLLDVTSHRLEQLSSLDQKNIFAIYLQALDLLPFVLETRRSIENRGFAGWYAQVFLLLGRATAMQSTHDHPRLVFRGESAARLSQLASSWLFQERKPGLVSKKNLSLLTEDRIWIESDLEPLFCKRFEMQTALRRSDWISPEFLLSGFTQDRSRIAPNERFWLDFHTMSLDKAQF